MAALGELIDSVASALIPPTDADPRHLFRWRLALAGAILFNSIGLTLHIALVCGYLTAIYPGMARADTLNTALGEIRELVGEGLESKIIAAKVKECLAESNEARQQAFRELAQTRARYQEVMKQPYQLLECSDVLTAPIARVLTGNR